MQMEITYLKDRKLPKGARIHAFPATANFRIISDWAADAARFKKHERSSSRADVIAAVWVAQMEELGVPKRELEKRYRELRPLMEVARLAHWEERHGDAFLDVSAEIVSLDLVRRKRVET